MSITEKIRKLFALAGDNPNENEMNAALETAKKLMEEHNISEKDVFLTEKCEMPNVVECEFHERKSPFPLDFEVLLSATCELCGTKWYRSDVKFGSRGLYRAKIYGFENDIGVTAHMFNELYVVMRSMATHRGEGNSKKINSYAYGFARMIYMRVNEMKKTPSANSDVTAIVLVKDKKIDEFAAQLGLMKGKSRNMGVDADAYLSGQNDARNVSLGTNGISGKNVAQIS